MSPLRWLLCVANIEQASIGWFTPMCEPVPLFKSGVFVDCMAATCSRAASRWHRVLQNTMRLGADVQQRERRTVLYMFDKISRRTCHGKKQVACSLIDGKERWV